MPIPPDLRAALCDPNMYTRLGAVTELRSRLASDNLPAAAGAYEALAGLVRTATRDLADPAKEALSTAAVQPAQTELHFGQVHQGSAAPHQVVRLLGPPVARACVPRPSDGWMHVDQLAEGLDVSIDTASTGTLRGNLALKGHAGEAVIAIDIDLVSPSPRAPIPGPSGPPYQGAMALSPHVDQPERGSASPYPSQPLSWASPLPQSGSPLPTANTPLHDISGQTSGSPEMRLHNRGWILAAFLLPIAVLGTGAFIVPFLLFKRDWTVRMNVILTLEICLCAVPGAICLAISNNSADNSLNAAQVGFLVAGIVLCAPFVAILLYCMIQVVKNRQPEIP